jgi:hypothetical protein
MQGCESDGVKHKALEIGLAMLSCSSSGVFLVAGRSFLQRISKNFPERG